MSANLMPPDAVRAAARRGLEARRAAPKGRRGGLTASQASAQGIGSGVVRAQTLASGRGVSPATAKRMHAFFSRHRKNKDTPKGRIAWDLWGGDPGAQWAAAQVAAMKKTAATSKQQLVDRCGDVANGVSLKKDNKGFYVATHRSRSNSYPTVDAIPASIVSRIEKTGMVAVQDYAAKSMSTAMRGVQRRATSLAKNPATAALPAMRPPKPASFTAQALMHRKQAASILAPSMAGPQPCIEGWGSPAGVRVKKKVQELKKKLQPGDIISTDPRKPVGVHKVFKALSSTVQGTRFGHSAMYVGDGQIVESRDTAIIKRPLLDLARCNEFTVHRVATVADTKRREAAEWMKKQVGKDGVRTTVGHLLYRGARPTVIAGKHEGKRQQLDRIICSSLIANAYHKTPFNPKRAILNHRPNDIANSEHTELIGVMK